MRHPGSDAARAIAGDFRNRAIRIEKTNRPRALASPPQILDTVSANSRIAGTQFYRELTLLLRVHLRYVHYKKIIATGMRLYKPNQSSSGSWNVNTSSIAGAALSAASSFS
jgi:hypothetical protein